MPPLNVGLIAGQGQLPLLVAQGVRARGGRVCCVGLRDQYDHGLRESCDEFREAGILQLGRWIRLLRRWSVREAVMIGRVDKARMHDPFRVVRQLPDWRAVMLWYRRLRHDHRTPAILAAVADTLGANGIMLIDSTTHIPEHLATEGTMGAIEPTAAQRLDATFAWPILERLLELGIGQAMAVRERDVIAVEAVEGTDRMVERAGELCPRRGWVLLKSSRADHDRRADVPTIGVHTVERVAAAGGRCIAVGAGRVILVDKPQVLAAADRAGVALLGIGTAPGGGGD